MRVQLSGSLAPREGPRGASGALALAFACSALSAAAVDERARPPQLQGPRETSLIQVSSRGSLTLVSEQTLGSASQALADLLQGAAATASEGPTRDFLLALRPCAPCPGFQRFGEHNDGGYVMCTDELSRQELQGAYSYGINGFDGWGMDIARRYGVPLFEYDCTDPAEPQPCAGCKVKFHSECLGTADDKRPGYRPLAKQLAANGHTHARDGSLLLKVDIEGAEWSVFAKEPEANLRKFGQVVVEFHWLDDQDQHPLYLAALQKLLSAGLSVAHLHGNNYQGTTHYGEYSVPSVLEVTFVRRPAGAGTGCNRQEPKHLKEDFPNNADSPELAEPKLPLM